jgi:hypothetical protein
LPFPAARTSIPLDITLPNQECKGIPHGLVFQGRRFLDQNVRRVCVGRQIIDRVFHYPQIAGPTTVVIAPTLRIAIRWDRLTVSFVTLRTPATLC